jgi:hypothetical protein
MNIKHLALVLGATVTLVGGGLGAVACSSSSSSGNSSGSSGGGSGSGSGSSSGGTMDSGEGDAGSGSSSGGSGSSSGGMTGADCGAKIPALHPNPAGDIYCGYLPGDSGAALDCVADSGTGWCCLGGSLGGGQYAPQICASNSAGCLADGNPDGGKPGLPIQCNQISDCAGNGMPGATACCLQGASEETCMGNFTKAFGGSAIVCEGSGGGSATACVAGEIQICSTAADCPTGTTCKPGKWKLYDLGFCQ